MCRDRKEWGTYAGGDAPGLSFYTADWVHARQLAGVATDTWGMEVRPNEVSDSFQPLHQVFIPAMGLLIGEIFDLEALADDCATDGSMNSSSRLRRCRSPAEWDRRSTRSP